MALALLAGYAAQVGFRLLLTKDRIGPLALPDEAGYLINARFFSGGIPADPTAALTYHGGYSLLITPAYWFSHDPTTVYRIVLAENATLSALVFPLAYALARRVFDLPRGLALASAFGVATLPGVLFYSEWAMADAILPVITTAWILCVGAWLRGGRHPAIWAVSAALIAAYSMAVHTRGLAIAAIEFLLLALVLVFSAQHRRIASAVIPLFLAGAVAAALFNGWIAQQNNGGAGSDLLLSSYQSTASKMGDGLLRALGALWASGVASFGLTFVTLVAGGWLAVRRGAPAHQRATTALVILTAAAIAVSAGITGPDEHRVGNWAYSRYVSCLLPALVIVGIWALRTAHSRGPRRAVVALTASVGVFALAATTLALVAGHRLTSYGFVPFDFPETLPVTGDWNSLDVTKATAVVAAVLILGTAIAKVTRPWLVITAVAVAFGVAANLSLVDKVINPWAHLTWPSNGKTHLDAAKIRPPMKIAISSAAPWYWRSELDWESYWSSAPVLWNWWSLDNYDAVALPSQSAQFSLRSERQTLKKNHWTPIWYDNMWDIWVRP